MIENTGKTKSQKSAQYQIGLMIVIMIMVMLSGFLLVPSNDEQRQRMLSLLGTTNHGSLISPALSLDSIVGMAESFSERKWRVLIAGGEGCDAACEQVLLDTKSVHMLLGKSTGRVQRVFMPSSTSMDAKRTLALQAEHPFLDIVPTDVNPLQQLFVNSSTAWNMDSTRAVILTPDNVAILYYSDEHNAAGLLDDLKHLLKYSAQ